MKKISVYAAAVTAALLLAACSPTKVDLNQTSAAQSAAEQTAPGETQAAGGAEDKVPDPNAPVVDVVSIFSVEGDSIAEAMDEVDSLSAEALVDKLAEYGVLPEGTEVLSYEEEGEGLSGEVGPGVSAEQAGGSPKKAVLNLSEGLADTVSKDLGVKAITDTFVENMNLDEFVLQVNGAAY